MKFLKILHASFKWYFWQKSKIFMSVLGLNSKDRKSTRDKANISNPKVNRGCAPLTANRISADCVQISLGPSIPYITLGVYHTGGFNTMNDSLAYWRMYMSLGLNELTQKSNENKHQLTTLPLSPWKAYSNPALWSHIKKGTLAMVALLHNVEWMFFACKSKQCFSHANQGKVLTNKLKQCSSQGNQREVDIIKLKQCSSLANQSVIDMNNLISFMNEYLFLSTQYSPSSLWGDKFLLSSFWENKFQWYNIGRLMQERSNSIADALELHLSWSNPSICSHKVNYYGGVYVPYSTGVLI